MSEKLNSLTMTAVGIFAEATRNECDPASERHRSLIDALGDLIHAGTLETLRAASQRYGLLHRDDRRRIEGRALALAEMSRTCMAAQIPVMPNGAPPRAHQPSGLLAALNTRGKHR
ncbi:MAG TPA: hypothetical protein VD995_25650 [Azospirillum sp.]|nr:hypothetical protein [Azospirillum sp.]